MKKKNNSTISCLGILIIIFFAFSMIDINMETLKIVFLIFIAILFIFGLFLEIKDSKKIKKNMESMYWDDPDARKQQEIYEYLCKNKEDEIKKIRKKTIIRLVLLILLGVFSTLLMLHFKANEIIVIFTPLTYLVLLIPIVYLGELDEEDCYTEILEKFISSNSEFKYFSKKQKSEYYEIKKCIDSGYHNFNDGATSWRIKDCIKGKTEQNLDTKIVQLESTKFNGRHTRSVYSGSFIVIDKDTNANIKILSKSEYELNEDLTFRTDNERFNNNFKIEKNDDIDINEYVTEDLIEYLIAFKEKYQIKFDILLKDEICIKFYTKNLFNREGMSAKNIDKISAGQYYIMVKFTNELVEMLNKQ